MGVGSFRLAVVVALVGPCLAGPCLAGPSRAESVERAASEVERAERLFHKGTEAFEAARYSEAYGALRAAWDLAPNYRNAAGLGQVELHLTQFRDAAEHLAFCLRNFPTEGDPGARRHVEEGLAEAREHVAALRVRVDPEGADVTVDGRPVGRGPFEGLLFVEPGSHVVRASAAGRTAESATVDAPLRATRDVSLSLPASASPVGPEAARANTKPIPVPVATPGSPAKSTGPSAAAATSGLSDTAWAVIVGGSLTAVVAVTAVVFDVKGASADRDVAALRLGIGPGGDCATPSPAQAPLCARLRDSADERNRDDRIALIAGVSAGVLGAATLGTAIFLGSRRAAPESRSAGGLVRVQAMPGGAAVMFRGVL